MNIKKLIQFYPNVVSKQNCDKMIEWFENEAETIDTSFTTNVQTESGFKYGRRSFSASVTKDNKEIDSIMYNAVEVALTEYARLECNPLQWYPVGSKDYHITKFRKREGMWAEHTDDSNEYTRNNLLSIIMFLNDTDDGEVVFTQQCRDVMPEKGGVLVFPSNWLCGYKITESESDRYFAMASCFFTPKVD